MSDTPITDAAITERLHIHRQDGSAQLFLELVDAEIAKKLERERNSLQDQRDFAMGEIERLRKEYFEMLDSAWGLIANAGGGNCNWDLQTEKWRQAATRWRDKYLSTPASKEEKEDAK